MKEKKKYGCLQIIIGAFIAFSVVAVAVTLLFKSADVGWVAGLIAAIMYLSWVFLSGQYAGLRHD